MAANVGLKPQRAAWIQGFIEAWTGEKCEDILDLEWPSKLANIIQEGADRMTRRNPGWTLGEAYNNGWLHVEAIRQMDMTTKAVN